MSILGRILKIGTRQGDKEEIVNDLSDSSQFREFIVNGVKFKMIHVEGSTFEMGATSEQADDAFDEELPVHSVTLSDYLIGETLVTQELWNVVMGTTVRQQREKANKAKIDWRLLGEGRDYPMYFISWDDCQEFIEELNALTGEHFRLPTEAEWEYAARGGKKSRRYKYSGSEDINEVAWCGDNIYGETHPVGKKKANELEIYDMNGNVWEWCEDWYGEDYYSDLHQANPEGPGDGSDRVIRGGSWNELPWNCRVSFRSGRTPGTRDNDLGFRLAL